MTINIILIARCRQNWRHHCKESFKISIFINIYIYTLTSSKARHIEFISHWMFSVVELYQCVEDNFIFFAPIYIWKAVMTFGTYKIEGLSTETFNILKFNRMCRFNTTSLLLFEGWTLPFMLPLRRIEFGEWQVIVNTID